MNIIKFSPEQKNWKISNPSNGYIKKLSQIFKSFLEMKSRASI